MTAARPVVGKLAKMGIALGGLLAIACVCLSQAPESEAAFPGVSGKIVFSRKADAGCEAYGADSCQNSSYAASDIYTMNADGTDLARFTFPPARTDAGCEAYGSDSCYSSSYAAADIYSDPVEYNEPTWSPDGYRIAFSSNRGGNWEIYVMSADGLNMMSLTYDSASDREPAWSPDGTKIAFISNRDKNQPEVSSIYVMNADGTNLVRLTDAPATDAGPAWSPDGSKIAFYSYRNQCYPEIYVMNADGSDQTPLNDPNDRPMGSIVNCVDSPYDDMTGPDWSPDGSKIVFASEKSGNHQIHVINADGSDDTLLGSGKAPSWSPDGAKIVFSDNEDKIGVMNSDGTGVTRLTDGEANDTGADWQPLPDGAYVDPTLREQLKHSEWAMSIVVLKDNQFPPDEAYSPDDSAEEREAKLEKRKARLNAIKDRILARLSADNYRVKYRYETLSMMALEITSKGLEELRVDAEVAAIHADGVVTYAGSDATPADTVPPAIANVQPAGTIYSTAATISADYSDDRSGIDIDSVRVTLDGKPLSGCTVSDTNVRCPVKWLGLGHHTIGGSVSDSSGNTASIDGSFDVIVAKPATEGLISGLIHKVLGLILGKDGLLGILGSL